MNTPPGPAPTRAERRRADATARKTDPSAQVEKAKKAVSAKTTSSEAAKDDATARALKPEGTGSMEDAQRFHSMVMASPYVQALQGMITDSNMREAQLRGDIAVLNHEIARLRSMLPKDA